MKSNARTVTFLFTDLEGSTPLWEKQPELMQAAASRHDKLMREAIESRQGTVIKTTGDGFHAAFESVQDGVAAAMAGQLAMIGEEWPAEIGPIRIRMGLHTGESRERDGDYYGSEVNRAARVMGIAHGGQLLLSRAAAALIRTGLPNEVTLADLGTHRLRGLTAEERIFQLCHPTLPASFPPVKSLSTQKHNLPAQLSSFVGRKGELADVCRHLGESRLVTLLGPGGTGKTRLMLEVAEEVVGQYVDGVWQVELAPLIDPDLIPEHVAGALTLQEQPRRPLMDTVVDFLRHKELLLLLDNVEHLVRESATFAEHLLLHCPKLKLLVTGREALFISGEVTLQIPSLSLPGNNSSGNLSELGASEGVQLFLARAQDVRADYELNDSNGASIAEIVRRLDGIPFALELAAARIRMLTAAQIADRLNDRFRLLTGGRRTALPRQQTLQAMIDWSWNLLDDDERLLLQRLSVFSSGWSLEAAQSITTDEKLDEYAIFDLLEQLVNKSLVTVTYPGGGEARYGLLESIRQYGRDRLFESEEGIVVRDRHADYFVSFALEAGPHLVKSTMITWRDRIVLELDNLRATIAWTVEERPQLALRIGAALLLNEVTWFTPTEARAWLEPAVEKTRPLLEQGDPTVRMSDFISCLLGLATAWGWQGKLDVAGHIVEEAVELAREHDEPQLLARGTVLKLIPDPFHVGPEGVEEVKSAIAINREGGYRVELATLLALYGLILGTKGEVDQAAGRFQEAAGIMQQIDNPRLNASIHGIRGYMAEMQGKFSEAEEHYHLSAENHAALNNRRGELSARSALAHLLRHKGALDEAEKLYRLTIAGWQAFGQQSAVVHQLECFAFIAIARGEHVYAATLLGTARAARIQLKAEIRDPQEIADLDEGMAQLAGAVGAEARDRLLEVGSRMGVDDAILFALNKRPRLAADAHQGVGR